MVFETLYESAKRGELMLIDGGMCRYHLRRDGQLTIYEIISLRRGAGSELLAALKKIPGVRCIVARCPSDLAANAWYERRGFVRVGEVIKSRTGRTIYTWKLEMDTSQPSYIQGQPTRGCSR